MDGMGLSASVQQPIQEKSIEQNENLLDSDAYLSSDAEIPVPFGKTESGTVIVHDIHDIPHMLICGFTGSGKTAFVQTVLATIATKVSSSKVGFIIYDSRQVEYISFQNSPHMCFPVITDSGKAISVINYYATETRTRLQTFASCGKKELAGYNLYCERMGKKGFQEIFFVLDDFATIKADKATIMSILDILRNGRIAGIHMIIVSSVASARVLQKDLLSNIPCRISFCLASKAESKVVLEEGGAEDLFVPGEMMMKYQGRIEKCQCAHSAEENISNVIRQTKAEAFSDVISLGKVAADLFSEKIVTSIKERSVAPKVIEETHYESKSDDESYDSYIPEAGKIILDKGRASVGLLQRELKLGFNRASEIMNQLHELGLVGEEKGVTPRKVLMTHSEWDEVCREHGWTPARATSVPRATLGREILKQLKQEQENDSENEENQYERIPLRSFPDVKIGNSTIGVNDNLIKYSVPVMTRLGQGTLTPEFNGSMVKGIIYKKPTLTQKGFLTFTFPPDIKISNPSPHLFTATNDNISDVIKIEFGKEDANVLWLIAKQISEDIQVPITVL